MLVSFSVANFRSFAQEETFSLVASKRISGAHDDHAVAIPDSDEKVLRAGVIYGANGAGKSNLLKALAYLRGIALRPRKNNRGTGREAFRLASEDPVSTFDLQFIVADKLYRFGFSVDDERVTEEWLVRVIGGREKVVYERTTDETGKVTIDARGLGKPGTKLHALGTVGGPQNQSFLATVHATLEPQDFGEDLTHVIRWLDDDLTLIAPDASYASLGDILTRDPGFLNFAGEFLKASSTGVDHLKADRTELSEEELRALLPKDVLPSILENLRQGATSVMRLNKGAELLIEKSAENHYYHVTVQAAHKHKTGEVVSLDLSEESDGTQRLLNLLPALYSLQTGSGTYFIDEIDRSMHPMLVWKFLEFFLKSCEGGRRQIIVTTHESNLLDLDLLRRDEIWFAEKDQHGATHLYSLTDFRVRKDLQIRKGYLEGRFGAVPFLGDLDRLVEADSTATR